MKYYNHNLGDLNRLESKLGYHFNDKNILLEALSHPSVNFRASHYKNYERLELLGDTILNFIITEDLFKKFPEDDEGDLAKKRTRFICKDTLSLLAKKIGIGEFIIMSPGEEKSGGRNNINNLENTLEALIAAIYLDSDLNITRDVIKKLWKILESTDTIIYDPKTYLHEWAHSIEAPSLEYEVIEVTGPSHNPNFKVRLKVNEKEAYGEGHSKKLAEKDAALNFYKKYLDDL